MSVNLAPIGNGFQFFTTTGLPLNGGLIYTYQAGSTTPQATYSDNAGAYANTNPIVLGTDGRPQTEIWLTYGYNYKFVLQDSSYNTIQTYDNLYGIIGVAPTTSASVPSGLIAIWSGATGSIPSGWYLCNGQNGTPDLRNSFVLGAGNTYAVGATGGSTTTTLTQANLPNVNFTATVTDPGHFHTTSLPPYWSTSGSGGINFTSGATAGSSGYSGISDTKSTGISVSVASGGSATGVPILPPYYALAYIMKS